MKNRAASLAIGLIAVLTASASEGFSQIQAAQYRIPQQIVINGQVVNGAYVTGPGGQVQSFTCPAPQHYVTADGTSQGWACYEETTGVWLLSALPPAQAQTAPAPAPVPIPQQSQQPPVIYQQAPPPAVIYQQPPVVYQQPPVVYQQPPIVYQQAPPTVIYQQPAPTVIYTTPPRPVVVAPAYPPSVVLGTAAINAAGRIASAAIMNSHYDRRGYYYERGEHEHRRR
jgi:hypothetical protein